MAIPIYLKIKAKMIDEISSYTVNTSIPSERDLAIKFDASRMTVRKAIQELVDEGILYRDSNRGTFVADEKLHKRNTSTEPILLEQTIKYKIIYFDIKSSSSHDVQNHLDIRDDDSVLRVVRLASLDDKRPQYIEEIYIAQKNILEEDLGDFKKLLDFNSYIDQGSLTQKFLPMIVPAQYAHLLNLKINTPIILVENVINRKNGRPLIYIKVFNNPNEKIIEITT